MAEKIVFKLMRFNTVNEIKGVANPRSLDYFLNWEGYPDSKNLLYFDVVEQRASQRRGSTIEDGIWSRLDTTVPLLLGKRLIEGYVHSSSSPSLTYIHERELYIAGCEGGVGNLIRDWTTKESADHHFHVIMALIKSWSINSGFNSEAYCEKTPVAIEEGPAPLWNEGPEVYIL